MCYFPCNSVNHVETSVQRESQEISPKDWKSILSFLQPVSQSKKKKKKVSTQYQSFLPLGLLSLYLEM